jgi:hypothetical protein
VARGLQFIEVVQQHTGAFVVGRAVGSGRDAPRGPVQQLHAEVGFQPLDLAGDGGLGHAQRFRRADKASYFHDAAKGAHRLQAVKSHN